MMRRLLAKLLLMFVSLIVALALAEFALRWISRGGLPVKDPYLGTVMTPGGDWDANSFRNPRVLKQADIVAIGDSQTMGWNAAREEAWPLVLGSLASASVYEMALAGYGPVQYAHLTDRALQLQPKVVIFGFYFGNDIYDAKLMAYESDAWKDLRDPNYKDIKTGSDDPDKIIALVNQAGTQPMSLSASSYAARHWIRKNSKLYVLLGDATRSLRRMLGIAPSTENSQQYVQEFANQHPELAYVYDKASPLTTTLSPSYRLVAVDLRNPATQEGWRITQGRLLAIKKILESANVPFAILLIPTKEKIYLEYMNSRNEKIPDSFFDYKAREDEAMAKVEQFCAANGMRCPSALQPMVDALTQGIRIYDATIDGHPQAPGYRVIAQHVHRYLIEEKLLSASRSVAPQ